MAALLKLITLVVIATGLAYHFSVLYSSGEEPLESFMANFTPIIINKLLGENILHGINHLLQSTE